MKKDVRLSHWKWRKFMVLSGCIRDLVRPPWSRSNRLFGADRCLKISGWKNTFETISVGSLSNFKLCLYLQEPITLPIFFHYYSYPLAPHWMKSWSKRTKSLLKTGDFLGQDLRRLLFWWQIVPSELSRVEETAVVHDWRKYHLETRSIDGRKLMYSAWMPSLIKQFKIVMSPYIKIRHDDVF